MNRDDGRQGCRTSRTNKLSANKCKCWSLDLGETLLALFACVVVVASSNLRKCRSPALAQGTRPARLSSCTQEKTKKKQNKKQNKKRRKKERKKGSRCCLYNTNIGRKEGFILRKPIQFPHPRTAYIQRSVEDTLFNHRSQGCSVSATALWAARRCQEEVKPIAWLAGFVHTVSSVFCVGREQVASKPRKDSYAFRTTGAGKERKGKERKGRREGPCASSLSNAFRQP